MNDVKNKLIELGFKEEKIGFVPYCIFYKYEYSLIKNNKEYEIVVILFSNQSFEIHQKLKELNSKLKSNTSENYFKGKISTLIPVEIVSKLLSDEGLKKLIKIRELIDLKKVSHC